MNYKIWVDADSCPKDVRSFLENFSLKNQIRIIYVANRNIPANNSNPFFEMIICESSSQAADNYILEHVSPIDFVITRDIPLAAELIKKSIYVINDRGMTFTRDNIQRKLTERQLNIDMVALGLSTPQKNSFSKKDYSAFVECFNKAISFISLQEKMYSKMQKKTI